MIEGVVNSRKNEDSQGIAAPSPTERPTYKTEITFQINTPYESSCENEDLVIIKENNQPFINKIAYSKLHRLPETSNHRLSALSINKYQTPDELYYKHPLKPPKLNHVNQLVPNNLMTNGAEDESDFIPCVVRSESVDTIDEIERELSIFVMDNKKKDKKRSNSFRKLFSVPFFGKDKKKKCKEPVEPYPPTSDYKDNYQNEANCNTFVRNTPQRHTVGCDHFKSRKNIPVKKTDFPERNEEEPPPEMLRKYANHHIDRFNKIRRSFESPDHNRFLNTKNENVCQDAHPSAILKYIDTSSSSTLGSDKLSTYQNALIAQAEMRQAEQNRRPSAVDISRAMQNNSLRRDTPPRAQDTLQPVNIVKPRARLPINSGRPLPNPYKNQDENISGHLEDLKVAPKEIDGVKSEGLRPELSDIYGTVFDAVITRNSSSFSTPISTLSSYKSGEMTSFLPKSPRSPSLEISKLKLPPNREIIPLQPRVQSPLPFTKVSSEKIIATELLKKTNTEKDETRLKRNSIASLPSPQNTIIAFAESTPENKSVSEELGALRNKLEENDQNLKLELDQIKTTLEKLSHNDVRCSTEIDGSLGKPHSQRLDLSLDGISNGSLRTVSTNSPKEWKVNSLGNVMLDSPTGVTVNSSRGLTQSPRDTLLTSSRSSITMSPHTVMSETTSTSPKQQIGSQQSLGVELRQKHQPDRKSGTNSSPSSPSKDEIRRSVEAYYWKEIKKIKEKEDYDIYMSHLHYSHAGYAEDPVCVRRSRGMEDNRSRRSLSVPRNARQHLSFENSNMQRIQPHAVPRGNFVIYGSQQNGVYGYANRPGSQVSAYHQRNGELQNSKGQNNGDYGTYKPIFRRGSLTGGIYQPAQKNKSVSFSNSQQLQNLEAWPTKNGFTNSPPQRRLVKPNTNVIDDDVFLPPQAQHQMNVQYQPIYSQKQTQLYRNYNSDMESVYGRVRKPDIHAYQGSQMNVQRNANYSSDSEALYGRVRRYKTLGQQELENLRNAQLRGLRPVIVSPTPVQGLTRHESIQLPEPTYGYTAQYGADRRGSYQTPGSHRNIYLPNSNSRNRNSENSRRDILITDDIYGQHIGYQNESKGSVYGYSSNNGNMSESPYGTRPKHVTVRNKVCDMYGRIHDMDPNSGEIQSTGVLIGQLTDSPNSPTNFRRNTRLTSSSNDIPARRVGVHQNFNIEKVNQVTNNIIKGAPARPLPPLPPSGKMVRKNVPKKKKK